MSAPKPAFRRVPLQARSRERVERILDAAEQEFAEAGYEAATTEAIAASAGASIGSLYQFFPNKKALFDAVAERYLDQLRALFDASVTPELLAKSWPAILDDLIDVFWTFSLQNDGFRAVWVQGNFTKEVLEAAEAVNREFALRAEALLEILAPQLKKKQRNLVATVLIEALSGMLFIAARRGGTIAKQLRGETKLLLKSYLARYLEDASARQPGAT